MPKFQALLWLSGFSGLAAVFFYLLLAIRLVGARPLAMVLSFAMLALSPVFLYYSRLGIAHGLAWAFFLAGLYSYLVSREQGRNKYAFLAGILLGAAVATHPNCIPFAGMIFIYDGLTMLLRRQKISRIATRMLVVGAGFLVPLLLCQALTWGLIQLAGPETQKFRNAAYPYSNLDYLDQLANNFGFFDRPYKPWASTGHDLIDVKWTSKLDAYVYRPWVFEGGLRLGLALAGCLAALARFGGEIKVFLKAPDREQVLEQDLLLLLLLVIPFLYFFLGSAYGGSERNILICWPIAALLCARWLMSLAERMPAGWAWAGAGGLILLFAINLAPLYSVQSGFKQAANWLKAKGQDQVVFFQLANAGANSLRVEGIQVKEVTTTKELLEGSLPRYVVVSRRDSFFHPPRPHPLRDLADLMQSSLDPVFTTEFRPLPQSYDFYRRGRYDLLDHLTLLIMGCKVKRNPLCVYLFDTDQMHKLMKQEQKGMPLLKSPKDCLDY
jgi:hypothetical protein